MPGAVGAPLDTGAVTTSETSDEAPAAIALLGPGGAIERATARFLERFGDDEDCLTAHQRKIDRIIAGEIDHVAVMLDGIVADVSAVVASDAQRYALVSVSVPPEEPTGDSPNPLLERPIDESTAIVWLKDLDGRYVRVNSRYTDELQADAAQVCGKTDAELELSESIEGMRQGTAAGHPHEPLELEYTVPPYETRPAFSVVRFALRNRDGQPIAVCGVAAPLTQAWRARAECARLMRIERWSRVDEVELREELLDEWGLAPLSDTLVAARGAEGHGEEGKGEQFAAIAAELDTALATSARLDRELAEERRQVMALREASILSARRAHELLGTVTAERARAAELEHSVSRAEARVAELETDLAAERGRAERAEARGAEAAEAQRQAIETLELELAGVKQELERVRAAAGDLPTAEDLQAERTRALEARSAAQAAEAAAADAAAALEQARGRADRAEAALAELRAAGERTESETSAALAAGQERILGLENELAAARDELARAERAAAAGTEAGQADVEAARAEADAARVETEAARVETEAARVETEAARTEAEAARVEAERIQEAAREEVERAARAAREDVEQAQRALREEIAQVERAAQEQIDKAQRAAREQAEKAERAARKEAEQAQRAAQGEVEVAQQAQRAAQGEVEAAQRAAQDEIELAQRAAQEEIERARRAAQDEVEAAQRAARDEVARATETAASSAALDQDQQHVAALEAELTTARAELAKAREELTTVRAELTDPQEAEEAQAALRAELERARTEVAELERARAELAELAELDGARADVAELERTHAALAESSAALDAEQQRAQALEAELDAARADAERAIAAAAEAAAAQQAAAEEVAAAQAAAAEAAAAPTPAATTTDPSDAATEPGPTWDAEAQLALSTALAGVTEWRSALQAVVKTLTTEGQWDAAIAYCPDERRRLMACEAISIGDALADSGFETQGWQHRPDVVRREFGGAFTSGEAISVTDLAAAEDRLLKAASAQGMGSALLVPVRSGVDTVALLALLGRSASAPGTGLVRSLEAVGFQLGGIAQLLSAATSPRWRVGRL